MLSNRSVPHRKHAARPLTDYSSKPNVGKCDVVVMVLLAARLSVATSNDRLSAVFQDSAGFLLYVRKDSSRLAHISKSGSSYMTLILNSVPEFSS